ncbi:MAG: hypothetical protein ACC645_19900 [Pirellulales bacterium]
MNSTPRNKRSARRGCALMTVSVFLVLMLAMTGVVHRHLSSTLRIAQARVQTEQRDEALIHALAKALELIETGTPPSDPYVCGTTIDTSQGLESITVTYGNEIGGIWSVHAAPTGPDENPQPMPASFVT